MFAVTGVVIGIMFDSMVGIGVLASRVDLEWVRNTE